MDAAGNSSRGRSGTAAAGGSSPATPDEDAAAAGTGKRAKKKAVRSSQKVATAAAPADPVRDEAVLRVSGFVWGEGGGGVKLALVDSLRR